MKKFVLIVFVLLFPAITFAQKFRPLLDPTVACSYGSAKNPVDFETNKTKLVNYFFIVEKMPKPKASLTEIENLIQENVLFIEEELNKSGNLIIQCLVNCQGNAGDFQIIDCPNEVENICCQVIEVLKNNFTEWEPGIQKKKKVDVLIKIKLSINDGKIEMMN